MYRQIKYDGFKNTLSLTIQKLLNFIKLRNSITYYFCCKKFINSYTNNIDALNFEFIENKKILSQYKICGRIDNKEAAKKIDNGSILFAVFDNADIVAYAFIHKKHYKLDNKYRFSLQEDERWIGPVFVSKQYRGKGINQFQISTVLDYLDNKSINKIYTSINSKNYPSIVSFMKNNFKIIGLTILKRKLLKQDYFKIINLQDDSIDLKNRIIKK